MKKKFFLILLFIFILLVLFWMNESKQTEITSFEECARNFSVMESYPEQCTDNKGNHFTRDIGNELEKADLIRSSNPRPGQVIISPILISGEARGYWFFEASFPVVLEDENGEVLISTFAEAMSDWMTEDFVSYEKNIEFEKPKTKTGRLILKKDNPSGLAENEDSLIIPVRFE